jgi:chromosome segregation ATPase
MPTDELPPPGRETPETPETGSGHSSRGWMIATCIFAAVAIGLGVWAFSLRSDNQDKDAKITTQEQQIEQAKGLGGQVKAAASSAGDSIQQALKDMGAQLDEVQGQTEKTAQESQDAIDQAEQAAKQAGNEADKAKAEADETKSCAQGYLSAITGAFDASSLSAGIDQAKTDIEGLNQSCTGILGS